MKNKNSYNDDFLKNLIQKIELDSPSDNFVENIMTKCYMKEVVVQEVIKSRFKLALPWVVASIVFIGLFTLTFLFGGGLIGGSIYGLFSSSSLLLKGLATMSLTYVGIGLGVTGGFILGINELKQKITMKIV